MDIDKLYTMVYRGTSCMRKGEVVEQEGIATTINIYPLATAHVGVDEEFVDMVFMDIAVDVPFAKENKTEFEWLMREFHDAERMAAGPSFIELGGVCGSQDFALRLMALGKVMNLWKVITPAMIGVTDKAMQKELAGLGFVMITPYKVKSREELAVAVV